MATGDLASRNSNSSIDMLNQLLLTFKGSATTTQTSSEQVSNDKATAYLQQILGGTSGLAAVSSGQKSAGLYNSTVNEQLTNDLLSRTAASTAALSATKTSTSQVGPQANPLMTLASLAGGQVLGNLAGPALKTAKKKLGLDDLGQKISDSIFGTSGTASGFDVAPMNAAFDTTPINSAALQSLDDLSGMKTSSNTGSAGATGMDAGTAAALGIGAGAASALAGGTSAAVGGGYAIAAGDTAFGLAAGTGAEAGLGAVAGAGAAEGGLAAGAAGAGGTALGGLGYYSSLAAAAYLGDKAVQSLGVKEIPHWIICTELRVQGRMPHKFYRYGGREFMKYDERGKQGYYLWAIPSVRHLRKYPDSSYSKLMEVVFNARAEYLSAVAGCVGARKTTLGFLTTHGLYAVCWILSRTLARKAVSTSQILGA